MNNTDTGDTGDGGIGGDTEQAGKSAGKLVNTGSTAQPAGLLAGLFASALAAIGLSKRHKRNAE